MNIHELEKQATPGPWEMVKYLTPPNKDRFMGRIVSRSDIIYDGPFSFASLRNEHNVKLLIHCRNNFMRAVEALKHYDAVVNEPSLWDIVEESNNVRKLIEELEEIR